MSAPVSWDIAIDIASSVRILLSDPTTDKYDFAPDVVSDAVSHDDDGGDGEYSTLQDLLIAVFLGLTENKL